MATEVEVTFYFPEGEEPPDQGELEAAVQRRWPDVYIVGYSEEEA